MTKKVTQLTAATSGDVTDDDLLLIVDNATASSKKATRVNLLDDAVGTDAIKAAAVTPDKLNSSASTSWASTDFVPSGTNITVGNGTAIGKKTIVGNRCFVEISIDAGSTTSFGTSMKIDLPETAASWYSSASWQYVGTISANNVGLGVQMGTIHIHESTSEALVRWIDTSTAYVQNNFPFTETTGDDLSIKFDYEIA